MRRKECKVIDDALLRRLVEDNKHLLRQISERDEVIAFLMSELSREDWVYFKIKERYEKLKKLYLDTRDMVEDSHYNNQPRFVSEPLPELYSVVSNSPVFHSIRSKMTQNQEVWRLSNNDIREMATEF